MNTPPLNRPAATPGNDIDPALPAGLGVSMPTPQVVERPAADPSGWLMLSLAVALVLLALIVTGVGSVIGGGVAGALIGLAVVLFVVGLVLGNGLTAVAPGQARVVQLLGRYQGTIRTDGLRWVNPF